MEPQLEIGKPTVPILWYVKAKPNVNYDGSIRFQTGNWRFEVLVWNLLGKWSPLKIKFGYDWINLQKFSGYTYQRLHLFSNIELCETGKGTNKVRKPTLWNEVKVAYPINEPKKLFQVTLQTTNVTILSTLIMFFLLILTHHH